VTWLGGALEGGRPPVADGMGIGEGDCAGEGIRWALLLPGIGIGAETEGCGVLCATWGELYPNWMPLDPPTGPPLAK